MNIENPWRPLFAIGGTEVILPKEGEGPFTTLYMWGDHKVPLLGNANLFKNGSFYNSEDGILDTPSYWRYENQHDRKLPPAPENFVYWVIGPDGSFIPRSF